MHDPPPFFKKIQYTLIRGSFLFSVPNQEVFCKDSDFPFITEALTIAGEDGAAY